MQIISFLLVVAILEFTFTFSISAKIEAVHTEPLLCQSSREINNHAIVLRAPKAMAQDYNLVGTGVVENPHKILPMLVGYHYSLLRSRGIWRALG